MATSVSSQEHILWRRQKLNSWLLLALVAVSSTACTAQISGKEPMNASSQAEDSQGQDKPLRNLNPSPKKAYDIRVVLKGPPGPFGKVVAAAQYDVANAAECGEPQPLSGAVPRISSSEPIELTKLSDTEYTGRVYVDRILDEDYHGRGTCHWGFVEARVGLRASDDPMATSYAAAIDADSIVQQGPDLTFFSSVHYPNAEIDNYANFGHKTLDHVSDARKGEFFEVEMSAREAGQ